MVYLEMKDLRAVALRALHLQHFKGRSSVSTAALSEETQRQKRRAAPSAVFETLRGTQPIRLVFNDHTPSSRIPRPSLHVDEKHVLVKLTLHGQSQTPGHSDVLESFKIRSKIYHPV
ncbi:hypothetical protein N7465_000453 [Penicillium sp. CMV-2018d]|nr:hypothetical protein N7465_000453 [Penicillium sp. CMV-2018d]